MIGSTRSVMESTADGRCQSILATNSKTICLTCLYDDHYTVGPSLQMTSPKVERYGRKKLKLDEDHPLDKLHSD